MGATDVIDIHIRDVAIQLSRLRTGDREERIAIGGINEVAEIQEVPTMADAMLSDQGLLLINRGGPFLCQ